MELFQELVFTISFSLIVSLLIVKLISVSSSCDDGNSTVSIRVEEKIEKEWVVCDSVKEEKVVRFEDVAYGCVDAEFGCGVMIKDPENAGGVGACDESSDRIGIGDDGVDSAKTDEGNVVESIESLIQEDCVNSIEVQDGSSAIDVGEVKVDEEDDILDDDWQGIETTELEKSFGAAVAFMDSKRSDDCVKLIDNEVKIRLYGLQQVAIEGSCFEPQPMALRVSARANWKSWKRLENLGREDAMEQYLALLSQHIPDWKGWHASDKQ